MKIFNYFHLFTLLPPIPLPLPYFFEKLVHRFVPKCQLISLHFTKHIVTDLKLRIERSTDPALQPPKIFGSQCIYRVLDSILSTRWSSFFKFETLRWQVNIIMDHKDILRFDLIEPRSIPDTLSWSIHVCLRFDKQYFYSLIYTCSHIALGLSVRPPLIPHPLSLQCIYYQKTSIMSGVFIFFSRVS